MTAIAAAAIEKRLPLVSEGHPGDLCEGNAGQKRAAAAPTIALCHKHGVIEEGEPARRRRSRK
jgi:hypothetical protein